MHVPHRYITLAILAFMAIRGSVVANEPVTVLFFYQPGCPECELVRRDVLPDLDVVFPGQYRLESLDVSVQVHAERLIVVQDAFDVWDNEPVSMLVGDRIYLAGVDRIKNDLIPSIQTALDDRLTDEPSMPVTDAGELMSRAAAHRRLARFTISGVMIAGLSDSLNPCAISVLIFFMSVLTLANVRGRRLAAAGAAFITASFVTYFLLGFGLLTVLRTLPEFVTLKVIVDRLMIGILLVLAGVSLRDAWVFHRCGNPADVRLQLPVNIKQRIRRLTRNEMKTRGLVVAAAVIGCGVTLLESVCTGQIYLPALVLMARAGQSLPQVISLLVIYNLMFVMPLIVIFVLVVKGLEMPALLDWSRRHVVPAKLLMAGVFLGMAAGVFFL